MQRFNLYLALIFICGTLAAQAQDKKPIVLPNDQVITQDENGFKLTNKLGDIIFEKQALIERYSGRWEHFKLSLKVVNQDGENLIYSLKHKDVVMSKRSDSFGDRCYGLYILERAGVFGIIDDADNIVIPFNYDGIRFLKPMNTKWVDEDICKQTLIAVELDGKFGLMTRTGEKITDIIYEEVEHIFDYYAVKKDQQYTIIDPMGKPISNETFDEVGHFFEDHAAVFREGRIGYLNSNGEITEKFIRPLTPKGYKSLDALFKDFVLVLRTEDDNQLRTFCKAITADHYSAEFMKRIGLDYKGFPSRVSEQDLTFSKLAQHFFDEIRIFRGKLKSKGQLTTFSYVGPTYYKNGAPYSFGFNRKFPTMATQEMVRFQTGQGLIEINLGEMIYIDGYWKSFKRAKL